MTRDREAQAFLDEARRELDVRSWFALSRPMRAEAGPDNGLILIDEDGSRYELRAAEIVQPAEPQGLGAVVEVNGTVYTRTGGSAPWVLVPDIRRRSWDFICGTGPVKVLSQGYLFA